MDIWVHGQNGPDNSGFYWIGLHLNMDIKPNLNSNINVKWTKYGKAWAKIGLYSGLMLDWCWFDNPTHSKNPTCSFSFKRRTLVSRRLTKWRSTALSDISRSNNPTRLLFLVQTNNSQLNSSSLSMHRCSLLLSPALSDIEDPNISLSS
jgi:hypothetical protein